MDKSGTAICDVQQSRGSNDRQAAEAIKRLTKEKKHLKKQLKIWSEAMKCQGEDHREKNERHAAEIQLLTKEMNRLKEELNSRSNEMKCKADEYQKQNEGLSAEIKLLIVEKEAMKYQGEQNREKNERQAAEIQLLTEELKHLKEELNSRSEELKCQEEEYNKKNEGLAAEILLLIDEKNHLKDEFNNLSNEAQRSKVAAQEALNRFLEESKHQADVIKQKEEENKRMAEELESSKNTAGQAVEETKHVKDMFQKMFRRACDYNIPTITGKEQSKEIIEASSKYGFNDLKLDAEAFYIYNTNLTVETVVDELAYAESFSLEVLKQVAIDFIVKDIEAVLESSSYDQLSKELMKEITRAVLESNKNRQHNEE